MARKKNRKVGMMEAVVSVWGAGVVLGSLGLTFGLGVPYLDAALWSAIAVGAAVALWVSAWLTRRLSRALAARRRKGPSVARALRVAERKSEQLIRRHAEDLARRRLRTRTLGPDGGVRDTDWRRERNRFIEAVILASLPKLVAEALRSRQDVRDRWSQRIDNVAARAERRRANAGVGMDFRPGMTGAEYEAFCADLLAEAGWRVFNKGDSADQGVDLIARKGGITVAIQCKRYRTSVGNSAVQEIVAGKALVPGDPRAAVVSNATYTRAARELAVANRVLLLHHDDLPELEALLAEPVLAIAA